MMNLGVALFQETAGFGKMACFQATEATGHRAIEDQLTEHIATYYESLNTIIHHNTL
jgi:hypothetical protein